MTDIFVGFALNLIFATVKSPAAVKKLKGALRKLRDILATLPLD